LIFASRSCNIKKDLPIFYFNYHVMHSKYLHKIPSPEAVIESVRYPEVSDPPSFRKEGRIMEIMPTILRVNLPGVSLGELCNLPHNDTAEVVGVYGDEVMMVPFREPTHLKIGDFVQPTGRAGVIGVGEEMLGRTVDAFGKPIDLGESIRFHEYRKTNTYPPGPFEREIVSDILSSGIRAIDSALTIGVGQRVGIFAPAGCGKSVLLSMLCQGCSADIVVIGLIGERGREVKEFVENTLVDEKTRARSVIVVATSDRPALERIKAATTATAVAEYFRDKGKNVLLLLDSLTRYARAEREVAQAAGEGALASGYPPSLYARLPRLLERPGRAAHGSITAVYTVLTGEKTDMLGEEIRSILDGHIILSRKLADTNHFPAIDVLQSLSRVATHLITPEHRRLVDRLRKLLSLYRDVELLIRVGEYQKGQDAETDDAVNRHGKLIKFLSQDTKDFTSFEEMLRQLNAAITR
jgi:ATP synthase in type III secretion protein N